ncbi:hypothetical protein SR42_00110 [Clostridium botulinum]|uniref:hypothetical protein n=1 Tax=Clostridium botulinum TaxID=1491 RepID=UPI000597DCF7|nr:hypothetical protein [Clostridium botulinum]KIL07495.1 hypothetical protein SR42_00110 [Clostridium botulinum]MBY6935372.1 hypothetical protein [Clostridium botulinum]NFL84158.1 hypothetical protein [Clostridium botulinum]NFN12541.1 hypothetical protein [Clostridium botulinum]NFO37707.1 hypothetical protein [Clostridium botulinum]
MDKNKKFPLNFSEIEALFTKEPKDICKLLIKSKSIILYDTNCFGFHANISNGKYYALDFFHKDDVVIFVEPIIREMNYKNTKQIPSWYLEYFKQLKKKVKALIYIDERDYINLLKIGKPSLTNIEPRVKTAFLNGFYQSKFLEKEIKSLNVSKNDFYETLINITNRKENEKNRGEIALFISVQILCSLKEMANYKIFSDDSAAYPYMSGLTSILETYYPNANIAYVSTIRNIGKLASTLNLNYEQILDYLNNIKRILDRKIYIRELPYDTKRQVLKSDEELANDLDCKKIEILF